MIKEYFCCDLHHSSYCPECRCVTCKSRIDYKLNPDGGNEEKLRKMKIKNNIIVECTENELYDYWLKNWSDFIDFDTYLRKCKNIGMKIIKEDSESE